MSVFRLLGAGLGCVLAVISAGSAAAQVCIPIFPWTCQRFIDPSFHSVPGPPLDLTPQGEAEEATEPPAADAQRPAETAVDRQYARLYAAVAGERFAIAAVKPSVVGPEFLRTVVTYPTRETPGTIVVDPRNHFLYLVQGGGQAIRYGVGVGREGFGWSGVAFVHDKQEWPDWYPPREMIERQPELRARMSALRSGIGMPGGPGNPLGSRAIYLWQGNKDTLYRIHGTVEPWTIGKSVSSGCIRMINQDVIDLYQRAPVGTKVVVLGGSPGA
ncbi:MAG TPA: L,D-transpeptidase [Pseudolabrys sp.]|nr:L,D-transpeptidase [Pseudolabrys sp.]